jgi:4-diphosphocytidyl-2-C-methyl-D-erythritol kinase
MRYLPGGERNLAVAAARLYYRRVQLSGGLRIELHKRIPVGAGLGGGSSDAAAVLRGLNEVHRALDAAALYDLALECGSDVPYCLRGGTQLAEGRGERLTVLPELPPCRAVLCKPPVSVSTAEVFGLYRQNRRRMRPDTEGLLEALRRADLPGVCRRMYNALEDGVAASLRDVAAIRAQLIAGGALGAVMSGSGPTVFGLFDDDSAARRTYEALRADYAETFLV